MFKLCIKVSPVEIILICKLVHTSHDKQVVEVVMWLTEDWYKGWKSDFILESKMVELNKNKNPK